MRGVDRLEGMLSMLALALPRLVVDRHAALRPLSGGALATDEVMRRVERGQAFRSAYRSVAAAIREGDFWREPSVSEIVARRRSTGMVGNLGLPLIRSRLRACRAWAARQRKRYDRALTRLAGTASERAR